MEKMINDYLATRLGMEPSETRYKELLATVNYLKDNGKTNKEIFKILMNSNIDLPEDCEMSAVDKAIVRQSDLRLHGILKHSKKSVSHSIWK